MYKGEPVPDDAIEFPGDFRWDEAEGETYSPMLGTTTIEGWLAYATRQRRLYFTWVDRYQSSFTEHFRIRDVVDIRRVRGNMINRREAIEVVCVLDPETPHRKTCYRISEKRSQGRIDEIMSKLLSVWKRPVEQD